MTYTTQFDELGREIPDPTPLEMPAGISRPLTIEEQIQRYVRGHLSRMAADQGQETFEEADDFELADEDPEDFLTPYEVHVLVSETAGADASDLEQKKGVQSAGGPTPPAAVPDVPTASPDPSAKPPLDGSPPQV